MLYIIFIIYLSYLYNLYIYPFLITNININIYNNFIISLLFLILFLIKNKINMGGGRNK